MALFVHKYGGSSLSDIDKIRRVAERIVKEKAGGKDLVIVVSAMGDTTDTLLDMANQMSDSPPRRELDMLLSVGERISMALLSMAISEAGFQAISLTGSQCGIITTDSHSNARVVDVRPFRVQDELEKGKIVIVAGYQGTSYRREVTTLGRGGSDTTAVALAAALGAQACEIYSDVDGIYSADPRIIVDAERLESVSYEEMLELSKSGARVLNEHAVAFAQKKGIALYAKKTNLLDSVGTIIRPDGAQDRVRAIEEGCKVAGVSHISEGFFIRGAFTDILDDMALAFLTYNPKESEAFLSLEDVHDRAELEARLTSAGVHFERSGLVSVVGQNIGKSPKWIRLGTDKIETSVLSFFAGTNRLSWVIKSAEVKSSTQCLHDFFVKNSGLDQNR